MQNIVKHAPKRWEYSRVSIFINSRHYDIRPRPCLCIFIIILLKILFRFRQVKTKRLQQSSPHWTCRTLNPNVENFQESVYLSTLGTMKYVLSILVCVFISSFSWKFSLDSNKSKQKIQIDVTLEDSYSIIDCHTSIWRILNKHNSLNA